jgi:hypothetical protein
MALASRTGRRRCRGRGLCHGESLMIRQWRGRCRWPQRCSSPVAPRSSELRPLDRFMFAAVAALIEQQNLLPLIRA